MDVEHAHEHRLAATLLTSNLVRQGCHGNQVVRAQDGSRIGLAQQVSAREAICDGVERHALHPLPIFCQISSAFRTDCGSVTIRFGHGRLNPSDGHFRVASIPILLP